MAIGEAGSVTTSSPIENQPITITLGEPLTNPVFAFSMTSVGGDDAVVRMVSQTLDTNGDTTSFTVIIEEWEFHDGAHGAVETINWLAIEEGVHTLADGRVIEAGTSTVSSTAQNTGGSETFTAGFTSPPVVLTSVMSNNDTTTVDSDPSNITATGFDLTLQEEELQNGVHGAETIGWIAIQAGGTTTTGTANVTGNTVTHTNTNVGLGGTFNDAVVLVESQTLNGSDTASVSINSQTNSNVGVFMDEERSNDTEQNHLAEVVGVVAFEDGLILCFAAGTLIRTQEGGRPIETLQAGDHVETEDGRQEIIRWIGRRAYGPEALAASPRLRPVRILAGALGAGLPERDLLVSRQHRILVRSKIAERMFGARDVLVPAIKLTELPGIYVDMEVEDVVYFHLLFDQHEVIYAEGTPAESLYTGPEALKVLSPAAREEILTIFPEITALDCSPEPARLLAGGKRSRQLVARHLRNAKPLL